MKTIITIALLLAACGGQDFNNQEGVAGASDGPEPVLVAGSVNPGAGGSEASGGSGATVDSQNGGSAVTPATGGSSASSGGESMAGSEATPGGKSGTGGANNPGTAGAGDSAGAPGPAAGSGGTTPTCQPKSWEEACAGLTCGKADSGCDSEYVCGSCSGITECVEGQCQITCETAGLECGEHHGPEADLSCGECSQGQDCGVVAAGKCSTCKAVGQSPAVCPSSMVLWRSCGEAPVADCWHPPDADPFVWCCL